MIQSNNTPLDYLPTNKEEPPKPWLPVLLELIPLLLIAIGVYRYINDQDALALILLLSGLMAALVVFFYFLYRHLKNPLLLTLDRLLAIGVGILLIGGIGVIIFYLQEGEVGRWWLRNCLFAGLVFVAILLLQLTFSIRQSYRSAFFRTLIARLLIFNAILLAMYTYL